MNKVISRYIRHLLPFLVLMWTSAQAGQLTIPNTFQANTPAVAAQVNANFNAVETAVDDNHARITVLENGAATSTTQISELENQVTTLQNLVQDLQAQVADLETQIANLPSAETLQFIDDLRAVVALQNDAQGNPTVRFSGVNVHVNNGLGSTNTVNGLGNLIVGYDEARTSGNDKTGSHNVVIGRRHNYSQYGGLVAGNQNTISAPFASVSGGAANTASGMNSSVSGGFENIASGDSSSVSGGVANIAEGENSSVSGGAGRSATDIDDWAAGSQLEDN